MKKIMLEVESIGNAGKIDFTCKEPVDKLRKLVVGCNQITVVDKDGWELQLTVDITVDGPYVTTSIVDDKVILHAGGNWYAVDDVVLDIEVNYRVYGGQSTGDNCHQVVPNQAVFLLTSIHGKVGEPTDERFMSFIKENERYDNPWNTGKEDFHDLGRVELSDGIYDLYIIMESYGKGTFSLGARFGDRPEDVLTYPVMRHMGLCQNIVNIPSLIIVLSKAISAGLIEPVVTPGGKMVIDKEGIVHLKQFNLPSYLIPDVNKYCPVTFFVNEI